METLSLLSPSEDVALSPCRGNLMRLSCASTASATPSGASVDASPTHPHRGPSPEPSNVHSQGQMTKNGIVPPSVLEFLSTHHGALIRHNMRSPATMLSEFRVSSPFLPVTEVDDNEDNHTCYDNDNDNAREQQQQQQQQQQHMDMPAVFASQPDEIAAPGALPSAPTADASYYSVSPPSSLSTCELHRVSPHHILKEICDLVASATYSVALDRAWYAAWTPETFVSQCLRVDVSSTHSVHSHPGHASPGSSSGSHRRTLPMPAASSVVALAQAMVWFASLAIWGGKLDFGLRLLSQARQAREQYLTTQGNQDHDIAQSPLYRQDSLFLTRKMASILKFQGKVLEEEQLLLHVYHRQVATLGREHPDCIETGLELASLYHSSSRSDDAVHMLTSVLSCVNWATICRRRDAVRNLVHWVKIIAETSSSVTRCPSSPTSDTHLHHVYPAAGEASPGSSGENQGHPYHQDGAMSSRCDSPHPAESETTTTNAASTCDGDRSTADGPTCRGHGTGSGSLESLADLRAVVECIIERLRNAVGSEDPAYLASLGHLAMMEKVGGNLVRADMLYRKVLHTQQRVLGRDHDHTLGTAAAFATLLALPLPPEQLALAPPAHGLGDPRHCAEPASNEERCAEAVRLLEYVVDVRSSRYGNTHPLVQMARFYLARVYNTAGRQNEAQRELAMLRESLLMTPGGADTVLFLTVSEQLAMLCMNLGNVRDAATLLVQVRDVRVQTQGESHPDYRRTLLLLGRVYSSSPLPAQVATRRAPAEPWTEE